VTGSGKVKIGNPYLSWAFAEVCFQARTKSPEIRRYYDNLCKARSSKNSLSRLRHHFSVVVFYMLKHKVPFDMNKFCSTGPNDNPTAGLEQTMT
jgi:hypothetical protein